MVQMDLSFSLFGTVPIYGYSDGNLLLLLETLFLSFHCD
jgi:hypothetical protein